MSSPRREWWSLLCSRRGPVRSLMRWVSSAIWTRVLPVSCAFSPNCATISALRSWVSVMAAAQASRAPPARSGHAGDGAGLLDVLAHLRDERVDGLEALLAAQALEELQAQRGAVDVLVEVEQVRLDQLPAARHEHRPHAHVRRRRVRPAVLGRRAARVDAVPGRDVAVLGQQVRGREAELAPALVAVDDLAADRERRPEQLVGVLGGAAEHEPADVARGHDLAVELEQRHDARLEALVGGETRGAALGAVAEAEVLAHADVRRAQPLDE